MESKQPYSISIVDTSDVQFKRRGKWDGLIIEVRAKFKTLPSGKSLRIDFPGPQETRTFGYAAKKYLKDTKSLIVGVTPNDRAVYIGRK